MTPGQWSTVNLPSVEFLRTRPMAFCIEKITPHYLLESSPTRQILNLRRSIKLVNKTHNWFGSRELSMKELSPLIQAWTNTVLALPNHRGLYPFAWTTVKMKGATAWFESESYRTVRCSRECTTV